jgi:organic radical activating enzyme
MDEKEYVNKVKDQINKISPSLCLAKWDHTTIYLQSGETHSCYHPPPHQISLEEIKDNPSALHNTCTKKQERKDMLEGKQPKGCQYCWNIEALGDEYISDRHLKSAGIFRQPLFTDVITKGADYNIDPAYVEISFGNECQMSCLYCHPKASSSYFKEIEQHGAYPTESHDCRVDYLTINKEEDNPYVKAWWEWYPKLSKTLRTLRITGGEPLLHQSVWRLLDFLDTNPNPELELMINSNLSVKEVLVNRLIDKVSNLLSSNKIKSFKLFTSVDTWGPKAEYIRNGLDLSLWERNFNAILTNLPTVPVSLMITYNLMTVSSFQSLLAKILEWRTLYNDTNGERIKFDTPYLKEPVIFDMNILPKNKYIRYQVECLKFMSENKFSSIEFEKFKRVAQYMESTNYSEEKLSHARKEFYIWITESDRRKSKNFLETFPEMTDFFMECKSYAQVKTSI